MQESGETYLETILLLEKRMGAVRSIDIANELGFTKPSVSRAISILKKSQHLDIGEKGMIILTEKGRDKANSIYDRHQALTKFLMLTLDLDERSASLDACRMEHIISPPVFERVKQYVQNN